MNVANMNFVVTGGSRGLGLGLVEMLVERGAKVTVVARGAAALEAVHERLGVTIIAADVTDERSAQRILGEVRPDVLILNAGARPPMGRLDQISWEDFTETWDIDVRAGLYWMQAALNLPLRPGSRILVGSSGAAESGSPLSGGYAGAKRMLWLMAKYANGIAEKKQLGLQFQAILPMQMVAGTGIGDRGAKAYAEEMNATPGEFLARFGTSMSPHDFGAKVISILEDDQYADGIAFGLKGDPGVTLLEGRRA